MEMPTGWNSASRHGPRTRRPKAAERVLAESVRRAKIAVAGIKSAAQRAAAEKPLRAVQKLLPQDSPEYQRGYQDGTTDERRKARDEPADMTPIQHDHTSS